MPETPTPSVIYSRFRVAAVAALALAIPGCALLPGLPAAGPSGGGPSGTAPAADAAPVPDGGAGERGCFARHLREAIVLNERRLPVYAAWSDGASVAVSRALIEGEERALVAAWWVDRSARRFQEAGVGIGCDEFVSMAMTPPLPDRPLPPPPTPRVALPAADRLRDAFAGAYGEGGFPAVAAAAEAVLHRLDADPDFHCMTRHLVESVWRVAREAPVHAAAAREAGAGSTRGLSELLLRLHLAALPDTEALDRAAAPFNAAGIPILCRDVPPLRP